MWDTKKSSENLNFIGTINLFTQGFKKSSILAPFLRRGVRNVGS